MSEKSQTGRCLCGAVEIMAREASQHVGACHCTMCRKWGGGPLMAVDCGSDVSFAGDENIAVFSSSDWAGRAFCSQCGTHLYYLLKEPKKYIMSAGLFDDDSGFVFDHQVFIDEKPGYYRFANETEDMTGPELFAKFAPQSQ